MSPFEAAQHCFKSKCSRLCSAHCL